MLWGVHARRIVVDSEGDSSAVPPEAIHVDSGAKIRCQNRCQNRRMNRRLNSIFDFPYWSGVE
jgi:hypothetical protein